MLFRILRGICLSTFSHDAVRILASPESTARGRALCKTGELIGLLMVLKGVLHPRPDFGLFLHFSQKLQHIGNKKDMFLICNISGNLITALEFH